MKVPVRDTLAWRLYAIGIVQVILLTAVFAAVGQLVVGHAPKLSTRPPLIAPVMTLFLGGLVIVGVGSVLTARWIVSPLAQLGRMARALGAGDLQARSGLRRSDELGDLAHTFDEMAERVERLFFAEKELLANVSHELRTPLARLRVALDIVTEADPVRARRLTDMGSDLAEIETLVSDILTATRLDIERGSSANAQFELRLRRLAFEEVAHRAVERFRMRWPERPLVVETSDGLRPLRGDAVLLRRVLDNLLENAHKYSPDRSTPIVLRLRSTSDGIAFEVEDRGIGVAEEDLPRLFAPFFRGDRSRDRQTGGVGLGLTLAKRIVEAHEGAISAISRAGAGTTFRVTLPAVRPGGE